MSDENAPQPAAAPMPRMTPEQIEAARAKIEGYLKKSVESGINLRPITGQTIRLARQVGIDLERLGQDIDEIDDDVYFDQVMQAGWLLSAPTQEVAETCMSGAVGSVPRIVATWSLKNLPTVAQENALMRAFIARWLEYRVEMQILRQSQSPEDPA